MSKTFFKLCVLLPSLYIALMAVAVCVYSDSKKNDAKLPKVLQIAIHQIPYETLIEPENYERCSDIAAVDIENFDRTIIEIAILCRAITIQGLDVGVEFFAVPNYSRAVRMVEVGQVHTLSESVWSRDVSETTYATSDVLRVGEFEKGIYVDSSHPILKQPFTLDLLKKYTAVTYKAWVYDWDLLSQTTDSIVPVVKRESLFNMLAAGRADFTLWEFMSNNNLNIEYADVILKPIPGVKVLMPDSRRFVFSKTRSGGDLFFKQINKGVEKMRKQGEIRRYYEMGGFINTQTKDWAVINKAD